MQSSQAFTGSDLNNSTANNDSFNNNPCSIIVQGEVTSLEINNFYGSDPSSSAVSDPTKAVNFAEPPGQPVEGTTRKQVPQYLSRLIVNRDAPGRTARHSTASLSSTGRSQRTSSTISQPHFRMIPETANTLLRRVRIRPKIIRNHMRSDFFYDTTAIPLWCPPPGAGCHESFRKSNICVGDVGFFNGRGEFEVLFNIFLSYADNDELGFDPPDGFQEYGPVRFSDEVSTIGFVSPDNYKTRTGDFKHDSELPDRLDRRFIASYRLGRSPRVYNLRLRSGNVLNLPNGAWAERMRLRTIYALRNYIKVHAQSWYDYYNKPDRDDDDEGPTIPDTSLKIITSSYKCDSWALAACSTTSSDDIFARLYKTFANVYHAWERHDKVACNTGPRLEETGGAPPLTNQCVAVEVYSIEASTGKENQAGSSTWSVASKLSSMSLNSFSFSIWKSK